MTGRVVRPLTVHDATFSIETISMDPTTIEPVEFGRRGRFRCRWSPVVAGGLA
jgi:hypothetical protein